VTGRLGLDAKLTELRALVDIALEVTLAQCEVGTLLGEEAPKTLLSAMRYAVQGGGKRMRPLLVLSAAKAVGGAAETALPAACSIEFIHAYSLVHDDLPAMDDDDVRRGRPTVHVEYGQPTAILTGDALLSEAFRVLADPSWSVGDRAKLRIIELMAKAAGAAGMVGGQEYDMRALTTAPTVGEVRRLHIMKTGALFLAAALSGGIAAGATAAHEAELTRYGLAIGRAFQLTDDVLDLEAGEAAAGDVHEDRVNLAVLLGRDVAGQQAAEAVSEAVDAAATFGQAGELLRFIAEFVAARKV
jgi:geranylgeranyl pyrophosphate synthase